MIVLRCTAFAFLLLLLAAPPARAQVARLAPVDEAAQKPSFFSFRARLLEAITRRDTAFLCAHTAPDVQFSFGAENGLEAFKERWRPGAPDSELWPTLARVMGTGGRFRGGRFVAPYVFAAWPDSLDPFAHAAIVGEGVRVRARPARGGEVLTTLSFAVVALERETGTGWGEPWTKVRLADGRSGYMASSYVRSPIGYRAGFEKRAGRWMMTFFVAGD